ncbi:TRAP transporter small permease [Parasedimentitalea maritima]|uniref:TRAP transporter small permease protein n=1 Tax=Parasedimentitalea maritima TaxID=2578117 RepID=A0ABY2UNE7_9RHOB|nr:TRAP transporter small permease [Zongyanglinia marina]TLP55344.1 TRAP transporter small permease [Zongyanglinia marina]
MAEDLEQALDNSPYPGSPLNHKSGLTSADPLKYVTAVPEGNVGLAYQFFLKFEDVYAKILSHGLAFFSVSLAVLMFAQVILRYGLNSPFVGIEEMAILFGAWVYFPSMAYVSRQGEHIHGGILTLVVKSPRAVQKVRLLMTVFSIAACTVFGYFAIKYAFFEIEKGRLSSYLRWPKGIWSFSLVVGFSGTILALIMQCINQLAAIKYREITEIRP